MLLLIDDFRVSIIILSANTGQISVECSDLACYLELPLLKNCKDLTKSTKQGKPFQDFHRFSWSYVGPKFALHPYTANSLTASLTPKSSVKSDPQSLLIYILFDCPTTNFGWLSQSRGQCHKPDVNHCISDT